MYNYILEFGLGVGLGDIHVMGLYREGIIHTGGSGRNHTYRGLGLGGGHT